MPRSGTSDGAHLASALVAVALTALGAERRLWAEPSRADSPVQTLKPGSSLSTNGDRRLAGSACPSEMVRVVDTCVDRWEASLVDARSGEPLSPYYPPEPALAARIFEYWDIERTKVGDAAARAMPLPPVSALQCSGHYEPMAVSRPGVVPQGYVSYPQAKRACERAGKRLCSAEEWARACRGQRDRKFPYGDHFERGLCNVYAYVHPGFVLHGNSSVGHRDPRLNLLVVEGDKPLLRRTGSTPTCASEWQEDRIYDMVGNLDEWIDDEAGVFRGAFYARSSTQGCESQVTNHAAIYSDYSTGFRCCRTP